MGSLNLKYHVEIEYLAEKGQKDNKDFQNSSFFYVIRSVLLTCLIVERLFLLSIQVQSWWLVIHSFTYSPD